MIDRLAPVRAFRELRREFDAVVFVLAAGDLVASFGFSLIFPFLTIYLTSVLHATAAQAGLILGLYSVASIGSNALGGWLADRFGRKVVMVGSITLTALVIGAMGQVNSLAWVTALTLVLGCVDPPFIPAARAAIADVVPEERRPRAYGLLGVAASVGWIAGPSIGAGLASLGYQFLFAVSGLILGAYTVILVAWLRETRPAAPRPTTGTGTVPPGWVGPEASHVGPVTGLVAVPRGRELFRAGGRELDPRVAFAAFCLLAVAIHAATFQWVATLPIHASGDLGISTATWGLLFALNGIIIVVFQLRISTASETRSKPRFMAVGLLLYASGYALVAPLSDAASAVPILAGVVILVSFGEMFVFPVEPSFVSDLSPIAARGRYQGVFGAAVGLGSALGPPIGGALLDAAPGATVWVATVATALAAAAGLWWLGGRVPHPTAEASPRAVPGTAG